MTRTLIVPSPTLNPIPIERPMQECSDGSQPPQHEKAAPEDNVAARRTEVRSEHHDSNDPRSAQEGPGGQEPRHPAMTAPAPWWWWWADLDQDNRPETSNLGLCEDHYEAIREETP